MLAALGFLILAGGLAGVWWTTTQPVPGLQAMQERLAQLEQRPAALPAATADLRPLEARIAALEQRPPAPDLGPLEARVATLEKQAVVNSQYAARLDALSARIEALTGREQNAENDSAHRLEAVEGRLTALEHGASQMSATAEQAARLARIQVAQAALAAGRPLGSLDGAPPAVARFATAAPPTEADLRLAFPKAAQAALAAEQPDGGSGPFLSRVLARAQELVTVRQGDRVLVGNPAAGVLARARGALDAGDLAGAVAAVSSLTGPPAAAMAVWLADTKGLLAARAGLADMAAHA